MKKFLYILSLVILIPSSVLAISVGWEKLVSGGIHPFSTDKVLIGASSTTTNRTLEVIGQSYFSTNVGIGTTSPGTLLSIGNTGTGPINFSVTATSTYGYGINVKNGCFAINGACVGASLSGMALTKGNFLVGDDAGLSQATSSIFISSTGKIGIGTTGPVAKLQVNSGNISIYNPDNGLFFGDGSDNFALGSGIWGSVAGSDINLKAWNNGVIHLGFSGVVGASITDAMTILNNGKVGIGTTTPNWLLQVAGARPFFTLSDTGASANQKHWFMSSQGGNFYIGTSSDAFATSTVSKLTITSAGNVGVGTTSPGQQFSVNGDILSSGVLSLTGVGTTTLSNSFQNGNGSFYLYSNGVLDVLRIGAGSNIVLDQSLFPSNTSLSTLGNTSNRWSKLWASASDISGLSLTSNLSVSGSSTISGLLTIGGNATTTGIHSFNSRVKVEDGNSTLRIIKSERYVVFGYSTSTAWTGTTTLYLAPADLAETWDYIRCETDAGTLNVSVYDGTSRMDLFNASTTIGIFTFGTNNTIFTSGKSRRVDIGTPATSPTKISCKAAYYFTY